MPDIPKHLLATALLASLATVGLVGCSSAATQSGEVTTTPLATATSATPGGTTGATTPTTQTSGKSTTETPSTGAVAECASGHLAANIGSGSGGAAGSFGVTVVLINTGQSACSIQGWPGVSFVGDENGTQIGTPAARATTDPSTPLVVQPQQSASAELQITDAGAYSPGDCNPTKADGFRIYPPDNTAALYAPYPNVAACSSPGISLLTISPFTSVQ